MADEPKKTTAKNDSPAVEVSTPPAPATAPAPAPAPELAPSTFASRIIEKGKASHAMLEVPAHPAQPAGVYEVLHGSICLGYDGDKPAYAHKGGRVQLTAEEAASLVAAKAVRLAA